MLETPQQYLSKSAVLGMSEMIPDISEIRDKLLMVNNKILFPLLMFFEISFQCR